MKTDWLTIVNWTVFEWRPKTLQLYRNGEYIRECKTVQEAEDQIRADCGHLGLIVWKEGTE